MPLDFAAIRARWAAATPGPWEWDSGAGDWQRRRLWRPIGCMEVLTPGWDGEGSEAMTVRAADAAAIAAAPTDIAALLSTVEAQQQEIARLRAGGCARDQRTTQYCAEAAARDEEIRRLRAELDACLRERKNT